MSVDKAPEPRPIEAKQRALEKFVRVAFKFHHPHHLFYYFYFLTLTHTRPRISLCHFFIHILTMILNIFFSGKRFPSTTW